MATVKTWGALTKAINKKVESTMKKEVSKVVKDVYLEHIKKDVYESYSPIEYSRRGEHGGLLDPENIVSEYKDGALEVRNIAEPSPSISKNHTEYSPAYDTQFAAWIERGEVYNGGAKNLFERDMSDELWAKPRPFTENTIIDLELNKQHKAALADGLKKRGIKIS